MINRSLVFAIVLGSFWPARAVARAWTLADVNAVRTIASVEASSRGDILYSVASVNVPRNDFETAYFILSASGRSRAVPFAGSVFAAHWSPDGRELALLTPRPDGTPGLAIVDATSGKVRLRATGSGRAVRTFAWSPDGRVLAAIETPRDSKAAATSVWLAPDTDVLGTRPASRELWIVNAQSGAERRLRDDGYSYGGPATDHDPSWSSDGDRLLVVRQPSALYADFERLEYVSVDLRTDVATPLTKERLATLPATVPPSFSPTGKVLTVHTWDGTYAAREDLFVDGADVSAALDRDFWSCASSAATWQGETVLATALDGSDMRLFRSSLNGDPVALTPAGGSVEAFSAWQGGVVVAFSTPSRPTELYRLRERGDMQPLTHLNAPARDLEIVPTKAFSWRGFAGHALVGQLAAPAGAKALLTDVHGGPQCADDSAFQPFAQYFATHGYAYFRPSVRGSDGYGDWSYKAIVNDFGPGPLDDLLHGVDAAANAAGTPHDASFLYGASYGGYLTTFAVTHDDRFRAAVAGVPVTDIALDYELSESPNITRRFFGAAPLVNDASNMDEQSPMFAAQRLKTPLLLMIGLKDTRAPYPQTLAFYRRLVEFGRPVRLLAYPSSGHGPGDPRSLDDWYAHIAGWFAAHGGPNVPGQILPERS